MNNLSLIINHISNKYNYYLIFFIMFFSLTIGFNHGSDYPIINFEETSEKLSKTVYNNPLPQVLMLTAIVVGVATFAVGLAIMIKINELERDKENTDNYIKEDVIKS